MKKNIFLLFLAICSFSAIHAEVDWKLDDNGTLTIWGTEMPHYVLSYAPWHKDYRMLLGIRIKKKSRKL